MAAPNAAVIVAAARRECRWSMSGRSTARPRRRRATAHTAGSASHVRDEGGNLSMWSLPGALGGQAPAFNLQIAR